MPYFGSTAGCVSPNAARFSAAVTRASASAASHAGIPITTSNLSAVADHLGRAGGIAQHTLVFVEGHGWISRDQVFDRRRDPGGVAGSIGHQQLVALFRIKRHGGDDTANCFLREAA